MRGIFILGGLLTTFKYNFCTNFTKPKPLKIQLYFYFFKTIVFVVEFIVSWTLERLTAKILYLFKHDFITFTKVR